MIETDDYYVKAFYYASGRNDAIVASFTDNSHVIKLLNVDSIAFANAYADYRNNGGGISVQRAFVMFQAGKTEFEGE